MMSRAKVTFMGLLKIFSPGNPANSVQDSELGNVLGITLFYLCGLQKPSRLLKPDLEA